MCPDKMVVFMGCKLVFIFMVSFLMGSVAIPSDSSDVFCKDQHATDSQAEHQKHHATCAECQNHGRVLWSFREKFIVPIKVPTQIFSSNIAKRVTLSSEFISSIYRPPIS